MSSERLAPPFRNTRSVPVYERPPFGVRRLRLRKPHRSRSKPNCRAARLASQTPPHNGRPLVWRCRGHGSNCQLRDTSESPKRNRTSEMNEANLARRPESHATRARPTPEGVRHSRLRGTRVSPAARPPKKSYRGPTAAAMSCDPPRTIEQDRPTSHQRTAHTGPVRSSAKASQPPCRSGELVTTRSRSRRHLPKVRYLSAKSEWPIVARRLASPTPSAPRVSHSLSGFLPASPRGSISRHIRP